MIAFRKDDIERIRRRAGQNPAYIEKIEKSTAEIRRKLYIQETAKATWGHYYLCPKHTVELIFNYDDPDHYVCPIDGEVFTGEPYEGAWWCEIVGMNCDGCYELAVAYMITGKNEYLKTVHEILLGYARLYPSYEVHGGIPYNNPGKFAAQVLNDSSYLNSLARAYDIVKDTFSKEEQQLIERDLLLEGAKHLHTYFTPQIHNHEVCICSALGIIGILLDKPDLIEHAVNAKYGLKYQLDHAVLEDGLWFEGSSGYHYYALHWFMHYEKFARYTEHSLFKDPHYREKLVTMLTYFKRILQPDFRTPALNDGSSGSLKGNAGIYEFAHSCFPENEDLLWMLHQAVDGTDRNSISSLLYGVDELASAGEHHFENYLAQNGSHFAILHGEDMRYLLFKALPFGGEHDHYDRLAISFNAFGKKMCSDLGTAHGYGAPLHYAYFKNTATHNTVAINGDNMPPAATKVNCYLQKDVKDVYLDAEVNWITQAQLPDSFVIKQWNEESYRGVSMRRMLHWRGGYFVDVFTVDAPNELAKDWILHVDGVLLTTNAAAPENVRVLERINDKNPQQHLHDITVAKQSGIVKNVYDCGEDTYLAVYALADGKEMLYASGPDNPSVKDICYLMERTKDKKTVFVNIIEAFRKGEEQIQSVQTAMSEEKVTVTVCRTDGTKEYSEFLLK